MVYVIFGLPGSGKTYTGRILQEKFGYHFYDGDMSLPADMKLAIAKQQPVTEAMRDRFFRRLLKKIILLSQKYPNLVVAQTYIKEKYRKQVLETFPQAQFVLVSTPTSLREKRLLSQNTYPLTLPYARKMVQLFEEPTIPHRVLQNATAPVLEKKLSTILGEDKV